MKKILIVEDENFIRENLIELLEIEGFEAVGAQNGKLGLEMAQKYKPDLILCDVMMPDLDGYSVLSALREDATTAKIPFMFLTASADRNNIQKIKEMGMDDYILKPFHVDKFLAAIAVRMERSQVM
jgi:DNA-binding response OmpR family regulator